MWAIYKFELARFRRTLLQSLVMPVMTTSLYFVVFGAAIGSRISEVDGVTYGAFIVPGLIMLTLFTKSLSNASFGIYFPKFTGTIYELLSAPISPYEIVTAYVGAGLRAAPVHSDAGHHAADVPGRSLLLDRDAAAGAGISRGNDVRGQAGSMVEPCLGTHGHRRFLWAADDSSAPQGRPLHPLVQGCTGAAEHKDVRERLFWLSLSFSPPAPKTQRSRWRRFTSTTGTFPLIHRSGWSRTRLTMRSTTLRI
jgi:ABC-2 type transport system permease protein